MNNNLSEIIIIGGGSSITPEISRLQPLLATKCSILTNYSYKHFSGTFLTFSDRDFYCPAHAKKEPDKYPDIYEELKYLPLIIGLKKSNGIKEFLLPNTYIIKCPKKELPNPHLTGIFALCIAEKLEPKTIYLLGFDWDRRDPKTIPTGKNYDPNSNLDIHYYGKEIKHRGLGYYGFYEGHNPNNMFKFFDNSKSKIYNVSPNSNIENFEKISYEYMFTLLNNKKLNQEEIRIIIKNKFTVL